MGAIEVTDLTKRYDEVVAVDGLSLSVETGEIFGLLGPNGAGKSTLINTLCTLLTPTSGSASVAGYDVETDPGAVRERIGVVFQEPALDEELTGAENLTFHGRLYGMGGTERDRRVEEVLDLVDLSDRRDDPVDSYSGGMKRRLELARGLLHDPDVLFLDEPTVGLDARTRGDTREYVEELNGRTGVTVVVTTHYMSEAEVLCDRVAIVDRGKLVACDTPAALTAGLGGDHVELGIAGTVESVRERLVAFDFVDQVARTDDGVEAVVDVGEERVAALVTAAGEVGSVTTVTVRKPTLERVFLDLTGRTVTQAEAETEDPDVGVARPTPNGAGDGETPAKTDGARTPEGKR
jgi:ABC-2 type transport system ATP-binding protein